MPPCFGGRITKLTGSSSFRKFHNTGLVSPLSRAWCAIALRFRIRVFRQQYEGSLLLCCCCCFSCRVVIVTFRAGTHRTAHPSACGRAQRSKTSSSFRGARDLSRCTSHLALPSPAYLLAEKLAAERGRPKRHSTRWLASPKNAKDSFRRTGSYRYQQAP